MWCLRLTSLNSFMKCDQVASHKRNVWCILSIRVNLCRLCPPWSKPRLWWPLLNDEKEMLKSWTCLMGWEKTRSYRDRNVVIKLRRKIHGSQGGGKVGGGLAPMVYESLTGLQAEFQTSCHAFQFFISTVNSGERETQSCWARFWHAAVSKDDSLDLVRANDAAACKAHKAIKASTNKDC